MTAPRGPDAGWARLSAGLIHDPDWLSCGAPARLVFLTGIALAKASNRDGEVSLRAMIGVQTGALKPAQVRAAAAELVACRLWECVDNDRFRVRSFLRWNESASEQDARRDRKVVGAHRTNHGLGRHNGTPEPDCPDCERTLERHARANGSANAIAVASERSDVDVDVDVDETPPPAPSTGSEPSLDAELLPLVQLADDLIETLGIVGAVANAGERKLVARALGRGWTRTDLLDQAHDIAGRDDVDSPRRYLDAVLRRLANTEPELATTTNGTRPAERRPLLDDERTPCTDCGASGWIDHPDGGVIRCTTCAPVART